MSLSSHRLKRLAAIRVSNVDKKTRDGEVPVRLVNYTDVYYRDRLTPDIDLMSATASEQQVSAFRLCPGDVLITKDSENPDDIGVPAYVDVTAEGMVCGYHLAILRPLADAVDGRYLYWSMVSSSARKQLSAGATGVTRYGLRLDVIGSVELSAPSLREQLAIADFLDTETARIDALIASKVRIAELLETRYQVWLRSRIRQLSVADLPLKRRWRVVDCKHRTPTYVSDGGYPVISPGDIEPGRLELTRAHRFVNEADYLDLTDGGRRPKRGDIIYSRNASIGIAAYADTDRPFCMGQDVCLITSDDEDQLYLSYVLNSVGVDQLQIEKLGTTLSRINVAQILELRVPAPEPSEQRELSAAFDRERQRVDHLAAKLTRQIDLLTERRHSLITTAVTGELDLAERISEEAS